MGRVLKPSAERFSVRFNEKKLYRGGVPHNAVGKLNGISRAGVFVLRQDSSRLAGIVSSSFSPTILPAVRSLKFVRYHSGDGNWVARQAEISLANRKTLYALDAFHIENGEIIEQQNHHDPRPA